jgi:hypothetical protein
MMVLAAFASGILAVALLDNLFEAAWRTKRWLEDRWHQERY